MSRIDILIRADVDSNNNAILTAIHGQLPYGLILTIRQPKLNEQELSFSKVEVEPDNNKEITYNFAIWFALHWTWHDSTEEGDVYKSDGIEKDYILTINKIYDIWFNYVNK